MCYLTNRILGKMSDVLFNRLYCFMKDFELQPRSNGSNVLIWKADFFGDSIKSPIKISGLLKCFTN